MSATEELYGLLPAVLRSRDGDEGEPLRTLAAVLQHEFDAVESDIDDLYENWFIETCAEWVVPYIGDLLGVRILHAVSPRTSSARAVVANTLGYRRRKGTAAMLEQLARDVTGWPARALEFFELLGTTQNVNHVRLANVTGSVRGASKLELLGGPFETAAHTAEVRSIARRGGKYNIRNVGLFLWRLQSYPLTRVEARAVAEPSDGRYTFNVLGDDAPVFNLPQTETEVTHLADEWDVPGVLRRRALHDELVDPDAPRRYFDPANPVFQVRGDAAMKVPTAVVICDLTTWKRPPTGLVAVDPKLGRIAFHAGETPGLVRVDYAYGFSGDLGGGPYDRSESAAGELSGEVGWQIGVSCEEPAVPGAIVQTLAEAVTAWNGRPPGTRGVIAILDSRTYVEDLTGVGRIDVPEGSELLVVAADWPAGARTLGNFAAVERRPHVRGDIEIRGVAGVGAVGGRIVLNGLLVEGSVTVADGDLGTLTLAHSTIADGGGALSVAAGNDRLAVAVDRSIVPSIALPSTVPSLSVADAIVGRGTGVAIDAADSAVEVQRSTVLGETTVKTLEAGNSLFTRRTVAARRQTGCVRFSHVTLDSRTPRRFRCQPDLALDAIVDPAEIKRVRTRVSPSFTSTARSHPAFAQLAATCPVELRTGADDGSEMGAFSSLKQPQREANLLASLPEYLRLGLEAGIFYVS